MSLSVGHVSASAGMRAGVLSGPRSIPVRDAPRAADLEISRIDLDRLWSVWRDPGSMLRWTCPFVLPSWLQVWTDTLGRKAEALLLAVTDRERVVGLAPLMVQDGKASFLGDPEVCDTFDCVVAEAYEPAFFEILLDHLAPTDILSLDLGPVRSDSVLIKHLPPVARSMGMEPLVERVGESFEVALPATWEGFLAQLSGKQRHEVRRKMRRLEEAGHAELRCIRSAEEVDGAMEVFFDLFKRNRSDKAAFMRAPMQDFFGALARGLAKDGMLRLFFLDLDRETVASTFCFDHQGMRYLYNNGYDDGYGALSVSLVSKIMSLRDAVSVGLGSFDFLKGAEVYKERLGGREVPLYQCRLSLNGIDRSEASKR